MLAEVVGLRGKLLGRLVRDMAGGPHLAVRVRIGTAHHLPLVLEDLDVVDEIARAKIARLVRPGMDNRFNFRQRQLGEGQIMTRRETDDAAEAGRGIGDE